jgi:hypothetical protein
VVAQPRLVTLERFTPGQPREDVLDHWAIDVEFLDVPADVFLACVPEQIEFGLIDPQDSAIGSYPMEALGGMVEASLELGVDEIREMLGLNLSDVVASHRRGHLIAMVTMRVIQHCSGCLTAVECRLGNLPSFLPYWRGPVVRSWRPCTQAGKPLDNSRAIEFRYVRREEG